MQINVLLSPQMVIITTIGGSIFCFLFLYYDDIDRSDNAFRDYLNNINIEIIIT